jgi:Fic family protein
MAFMPRFRITNALTSALARIERARGYLEGVRLAEDWVASMRAWAMVVETHHSTRLAGTRQTLDMTEGILAGRAPDGMDPGEIRSILAYRDALDWIPDHPTHVDVISEERIRLVHQRLMGDGTGPDARGAEDGAYRSGAGEILDPRTQKAIFTPPAPGDLPDRIAEFVGWVGQSHGTDEVLAAGIAQVLFTGIRPFDDGNGRTARLISLFMIRSSGYDMRGLFSLSEPYDRDPAVYLRAMRSVRERGGDLTVWLEYFAEMLAIQMRDVQDRAERVVRRDSIARMHPLSQRQRAALAHALLHGGITIRDFENICPGVGRATLQKDLRVMEERGLLAAETVEGGRYYRLTRNMV